MAESALSNLARTLRDFSEAFPRDHRFALVGGIAVSSRTEPRFTRDLDFAVSVVDDPEAEALIFAVQARGFLVESTVEHETTKRLATVRLRQTPKAPIVDLLFASCGIEREIVEAASLISVLGERVAVAQIGHLIAMKLLSTDPKRRPRDDQDLVMLAAAADDVEWARATESITLIASRGCGRGRDLGAALNELRARPRE